MWGMYYMYGGKGYTAPNCRMRVSEPSREANRAADTEYISPDNS